MFNNMGQQLLKLDHNQAYWTLTNETNKLTISQRNMGFEIEINRIESQCYVLFDKL